MIQAQALIDKFKYALTNHWGYIWGTAGVQWTKAKQDQKIQYMVNKYGATWKKDAEAKTDNYYNAALYGEKWIGHTVADCSGLFSWAFKQLGGSIAHGSNSIYDRYCSSKGKMTDDVRKTIKPGTAVFTGTEKSHGHIGLFIGNGKVIEAQGTQAGVCTSNLSAGKWTFWGELKNVQYEGSVEPVIPSTTRPTLRKGDKGAFVTLAQTELLNKGYDLGRWGVDGDFGNATENAVKAFQRDNGLVQDGVIGEKTWEKLDGASPVKLYSVIIQHLTASEADAVLKNYPGAIKEEERG